jgi:flagellar basal-body rod protein FlgC
MSKVGEGGPGAIAIAALQAQQARMRIIAENVANAASTGRTAGAEPYRRQIPVFAPLKMEGGALSVQMSRVELDSKPFNQTYDPSHPAADARGYVLTPNVSTLVEALDMKMAQRAYEANLNMLDTSHAMEQSAINMMKK